MAFVIMLELVESRAQAMFISAVIAKSGGNKDVEIVSPADAREAFIEFLGQAPKQVDPDTAILMKALFPKS